MSNTGRLREMDEGDLGTVLHWRNDLTVRNFMVTQHEISVAEHSAWFYSASSDLRRKLMIFERNDEPLGFVHFSGVRARYSVDWGFYTSPSAVKGTGQLLGRTALAYAFQDLEVHKVCGQALAFNQASVRLHQKLGFAEEGVLREQCLCSGQYHDMICFGLLARDWLSTPSQEKASL